MIRKRIEKHETVINLDGPDGNAQNLMGTATMFGRDLRMNEDTLKSIIKEMRAGDYIHLLKIFEKHFGMYCVLETGNEEYLEALL